MREVSKAVFRVVMITMTLLTLSCSKNETPVQAPAPPANTPAPTPAPGPIGGSCGNLGPVDYPLRKDNTPYQSTLTNQGGFNQRRSTNTLSLQLFYVNYTYAESMSHNIAGSGLFSYPDLLSTGGYPVPSSNYSFCVSTAGLQSSPSTPGIFEMRELRVSIRLRGLVQIPLYSPYSGYPGGFYPGSPGTPPMGQEIVELDIGGTYDCPAFLYQGRIVGCADVSIGPAGYGPTTRYRME